MTALEIKHPWQQLQRAQGVEVRKVNALELGRPFRFTDEQRIALQPYFTAAGEGGAVLITATHSAFENYLTATPLALTQPQRKSISGSLTRIKNQNL
jgi:hypothetical protein